MPKTQLRRRIHIKVLQIPYQSNKKGFFEKARSTGHVPIIKNRFVQEKLKHFKLPIREKLDELPKGCVKKLKKEINKQELPNYVLSFDGSNQEVTADENFPSTRIGYIQTAVVLIMLKQMLDQQNQSLVDPSKFKQTMENSLQSIVMPGANVCEQGCIDLRSSWRYDIYELFNEYEIEDRKIMDVYWELLKHTGLKNSKYKRLDGNNVILKSCSVRRRCEEQIMVSREGTDCPRCRLSVYPTDILRIHEEVQENQQNIRPLNRLMSVLEQLYMVGYLDFLLKRRPEDLSKFAFIVDGPLAVMGPSAWLHRAILNFINEKVYKTLKSKNIDYPIILGVSKSGKFVDNANRVSKYLETQEVMYLSETYMNKYILSAQPSEYHGSETYYGQYMFYKNIKGQMITFNIPKLRKGPSTEEIFDHPTLLRTLHLLDNIGTKLYKDALIPVALAHSYASIPLKTGSRILKILTKEKLEKS